MVTERIKAVNYFTGYFDQPIKLEILATGATVYVDSLAAVGFMRIGGLFSLCLQPFQYQI